MAIMLLAFGLMLLLWLMKQRREDQVIRMLKCSSPGWPYHSMNCLKDTIGMTLLKLQEYQLNYAYPYEI